MAPGSNSSKSTRAVLQALLRTHPNPTYGYDLSKATNLKSGTLYPILKRLHAQGHLHAQWEDSPHPGRPPRHVYTLTDRGLQLAQTSQTHSYPALKGALL